MPLVADRRFRRILATVTLGAVLVLLAGLAGVWPPLVATGIAAGAATVLPAVAMIGRGWAIRAAARQDPLLRGRCRCSGMLGMGTLMCGLTAAGLPLANPLDRPMLATGGLVLAATLYTIGLLHLPGIGTVAGRSRLALDGLVVGCCVVLVGWLFAPGLGVDPPTAYLAAAVAASCAATIAVALLRTSQLWPAAAWCGSGAALAILGLALLAVVVGRDAPAWLLLGTAGLIVFAPAVTWLGAGRAELAAMPARPRDLAETSGGYPVYALPLAGAVFAIVHHVATAVELDRGALLFGAVIGGLLAVREVPAAAERRRAARGLAAQAAHLRALITGGSDVTMLLGDDLVVRWQSAGRQFGLADRQVVGRRFTELLHPDDVAAVVDRLRAVLDPSGAAAGDPPVLEARIAEAGGGWRDTESTVSDLRAAPEVGALVMQIRDVGQRRALERTLHRLTSRDELTGLPDRRELLRAIAARRGAGHRSGVLLVVGLAGFCEVNDAHGHAAGDELLVAVARRLSALAGTEAVVARTAERELAVLTPVGPVEAYALGFRLVTELSHPYQLRSGQARLTAQVGLATLAGGAVAEEVLRRGLLALQRAGGAGQPGVDWYDESLEEHLVRRLDLERHLPGATGRGELDVIYQPVLRLADATAVGVEALLRWRHPALGTVLPGELLPVADKLGLGAEIGEWVLHTACRQVARWRRDGHDLWLAVNLSVPQLTNEELVPEVAAALSVHGCPPERLLLEVAEAELGGDLAAVAGALSRLRALGVRTALDDFGTGDTDLSRLRRLPLDLVKLCPPVAGKVAGPSGGPADRVPEALLAMAHQLGLTVIAEGLETESQRERMARAGCEFGQGYLLAQPVPAASITSYLTREWATVT